MNLNKLSSISKKAKRVGRGGKRGVTSGRGTKGQKSRAGRRIRPAERDLVLSIPKRRGFRNKPWDKNVAVFNVGSLSTRLKKDGRGSDVTVTKDLLISMGLLPKKFQGEIKVLGHGKIETSFSVKGFKLSKEAGQKIEVAGGKIMK